MAWWPQIAPSKATLIRAVSVLTITLAVQYAEYEGLFANIEGGVLDLFLRRTQAKESSTVVVQIGDEAYRACFGSQSPLNPYRIASVVKALQSAAPSVIAVDILTDEVPAAESSAYRDLAAQIGKPPQTVWIAGSEKQRVVTADFFAWLIGARDEIIIRPTRILGYEPGTLPRTGWAVSVSASDEDLRLRRLPRRVAMSSDPDDPATIEQGSSLARTVAEIYCRSHSCKLDHKNENEVYFSYGWPSQHFDVERLFHCPQMEPTGPLWEEFAAHAVGKIVLVGGTFSDIHATPVGRIAGVDISAHAINSEINGTNVAEVPRYAVVALDLLVGCFIVVIFASSLNIRAKIVASLALTAMASLTSVILMWRGLVWLTWIGVAVGLFPHIVWEIYHAGGAHVPPIHPTSASTII
jgi:CHASE2 domain-containing sensor protein